MNSLLEHTTQGADLQSICKSKFEHGLTNTSVTNDLLLIACQ